MILETVIAGHLDVNCYLIGCEESHAGAVIDPGGDAEEIIKKAEKLGLKLKYIVCTHGHVDHIAAVDEIRKATGAKVMIHGADAEMLTDPQKNLSVFMGEKISIQPADIILKEGDVIDIGTVQLEVLHVPGHTPGGICLKTPTAVFSGDTLFAGSIGRSDFPGGNHGLLVKGIKEKLLTLPDETRVYPGHGPDTLIGQEKRHNPFLA